MPKTRFEDTLEGGTREEFLTYLKNNGARKTSEKYFEILGKKQSTLYQLCLRIQKRHFEDGGPKSDKPDLSEVDKQLVEDFKEGKIGFEEMQKEISARMYEKMLAGEIDVKVRDWLASENVKLRKEKTEKQKDAMEVFIDTLFSGFIPSPMCPHCHQPTTITPEELDEHIG